jgi:cyclase
MLRGLHKEVIPNIQQFMTKSKNLWIFPLMLLFVSSFSLSKAQQKEALPVKLNQIGTGLYEILEGRGANDALIIGDNAVLVVDSKMDKKSVDETLDAIKKITDKPIKYLVNTHSDGDHVTGNQFFPASVIFISHENCLKEMLGPGRNGVASIWLKPELSPFLPSITFNSKMDIYLGSKKVELWYFGVGHTTGDAVVYIPAEKIAFIGDQAFLGRPQLIHSYKGGNSFEHVKTLTKMLETIDATKFYSGHSIAMDREGIQKLINQMKERQEKVKNLIKQNKTLEEIKKEFASNEAALIESIYNELKK